jgi:hypothetical protein
VGAAVSLSEAPKQQALPEQVHPDFPDDEEDCCMDDESGVDDTAFVAFMSAVEEDLQLVSEAEQRAELDQILIEAGYRRNENGALLRASNPCAPSCSPSAGQSHEHRTVAMAGPGKTRLTPR